MDISALGSESHRRWFGLIESRLRSLLLAMEQFGGPNVRVHPHADFFTWVATAQAKHDGGSASSASNASTGGGTGGGACEAILLSHGGGGGGKSSKERGRVEEALSSGDQDGPVLTTSFFAALSFGPTVTSVDLTPGVTDWVHKVRKPKRFARFAPKMRR